MEKDSYYLLLGIKIEKKFIKGKQSIIALAAGVHQTTVSKVLTGKRHKNNTHTQQKILTAIKKHFTEAVTNINCNDFKKHPKTGKSLSIN